MERRSSNYKRLFENDSLGILSMENLKAFGETSGSDSISGSSGRVSDRLNTGRYKALETLNKYEQLKKSNATNKENLYSFGFDQTASASEKSDFVPYRRPKHINISELITDETINLENITISTSTECNKEKTNLDSLISFEPSEITGRSTLCRGSQHPKKPVSRVSVAEILASSFAKKARDLSETVQSSDFSVQSYEDPNDVRRQSSRTNCSSFIYNGIHSLPKTADLSVSKPSLSGLSINGGDGFSFSSSRINQSKISDANFAPSEVAMSKLVIDEIVWANQYAAIPTATLSKQAKEKANCSELISQRQFETPSVSNSMIESHNFSVGTFFNMRSEDIGNIVKSKSPVKCRTPIALVEEDSIVDSTNNTTDIEKTPKIDNKTYTKDQYPTVTKAKKSEQKENEPTRAGTDIQDSFLLSMSAIDKALCDLNVQNDNSDVGILLSNAKKLRSQVTADEEQKISESENRTMAELFSENKENLDPEIMRRSTVAETLNFSNSVLSSSDLKTVQQSGNLIQRSPLSPLNLSNPCIQITSIESNGLAGHEADVDEWPSTPIKSHQRKVRRTKSPNDMASSKQLVTETLENSKQSSNIEKSPVRSYGSQPKSLCSTRIEGDKHESAQCDFAISPSMVQRKSPGIIINEDSDVLAQTSALTKSTLSASNQKKNHSLGSPVSSHNKTSMSSPRRVTTSPAMSGYHSPHLDVTTNSEKRILSAGTLCKAFSSPIASEPRSSNYGGPTRSYSSTSIRNPNTCNSRSVSRCSNSSEFSHRDGKVIPLKVTTLELSWGSTKLRTEARKTMQVKNISNKRLVVRLEINGPGFQIANMQSSTVTLQSQECRSIIINFCPTVSGAAVGHLLFYSPIGTTSVNMPFLEIPLYAYGGHAAIIPLNMCVGPVGSPFMRMGSVGELSRCLEKTFEIYNKGPLLGFASVSVDSLGLMMPSLSDAFEVKPSAMLIPPGKSVHVSVLFKPRRDDIKKILKKIQQVLTLANMRLIFGDEANRQRVRRLLQHLSSEERSKISSSTLDNLWCTFPKEPEINEFTCFKEKPEVIMDLITCMRNQEIALTINRESMDDTIESSSIFLQDADETVLFRTICAASPTTQAGPLQPVDEGFENSTHERTDNRTAQKVEQFWSVSPIVLLIDFQGKFPIVTSNYKLTICNKYKSRQYFELFCNRKNLFTITPNEGYISPDGVVDIDVFIINEYRLFQECCRNDIFIMVNIENERISVPVKARN